MIAFTLCSNNYLAQAKTLGDSFVRHNPESRFVIGLVDRRRDDVDYAGLGPFEILPVEDIAIPSFESFWKRYEIVELNTAVKPYYFAHLLGRQGSDVVLYFDPDMEVYAPCQVILDELGDGMSLLTPHALSPLPYDGPGIWERSFLGYGIYNLGFIGVANRQGREEFLEWWQARTARWGYRDVAMGLFVDQLWMNLAPLYFRGVEISRHPGLNMAYWNLHERVVSEDADGSLMVNDHYPLVFFHFSALDPLSPESIAKYQHRFSLATRPDLDRLFRSYAERLHENGCERYTGIECAYIQKREQHLQEMRSRHAEQQLHLRRSSIRLGTAWSAHRCLRAAVRILDRLDAPLRSHFPGPEDHRQ